MAAILQTCDLTVLANYGNVAPGVEPVTSGHWDDISYDALSNTTVFTDFSATFPAQAVNWWLQPHAARSTYLPILAVAAGQIIVEGNALNLASGLLPFELGSFYTIVWPAGVDPQTGTLAHGDPCNPASRLLWAGYLYMPPVAGTKVAPNGSVGTTTYGAQPGGNYTGDYSCWNRIYNPHTARWTTPDPAASPWWNAQDYVGGRPAGAVDPSGLKATASWTTGVVQTDFWGNHYRVNTFTHWDWEYKVTIEGCDCCFAPETFGETVNVAIARVIAVVTELSVMADKMKEKKDQIRWASGVEYTSAEMKLIRLFATVRHHAVGHDTSTLSYDYHNGLNRTIDDVQKALDQMWSWMRKPGIKLMCVRKGKKGAVGEADVIQPYGRTLVRIGSWMYYNCDTDPKDSASMARTIIHELSYLAAGTYDDSEDGKQRDAYIYGSLEEEARGIID